MIAAVMPELDVKSEAEATWIDRVGRHSRLPWKCQAIIKLGHHSELGTLRAGERRLGFTLQTMRNPCMVLR